jgi:glycosyltransferase involved in cell wall biosynthesis
MHVLIIPGEELNEKNQLSSVFEIHQAMALSDLNLHVGFISVNLKGSIYNEIKEALQNCRIPKYNDLKISNQKINGINLIEVIGVYFTPSILKLYRKERVNAGVRAYRIYVEKFGKPDIIHAHSRFLDSAMIAHKIFKAYDIPFVFTEHSSFHQRNMVSKKEYVIYKNLIKSAKNWIVVSRVLGQNIISKLLSRNLYPDKTFVVLPNILDSQLMKIKVETIDNFNNNNFTFLNIASLDENKNHEVLIESFALISKRIENLQLRIGGDGVLKETLKEKVKSLNLQNVKFLGLINREEVQLEIYKSDAFVLSSNVETFGVVLIEAMSLGKPVISTKSGGPNEIVDERNGILVEPKNIQQLSDAMEFMIKNYSQFNSKKISENCVKKYGAISVGEKLIEIYKDTLN